LAMPEAFGKHSYAKNT
ncbi:unnamed protein product, partial [Adineta steineri]